MSRTNIELDDDLVQAVMLRFGARTKREAVDLALRRLVGPPITQDFVDDLRGIGWDGDKEALRSSGPMA